MSDRSVMFMPDLHAPDHDPVALSGFLKALRVINPDELVILGDFIDCHAPARWSKATAAEYAGTLPSELAAGKQVLSRIRGSFNGPVSFIMGNHEDRILTYTKTYAPAIAGLVPSLPELLDFDTYNVQLQQQPYRVAPDVSVIHGKALSSVLSAAGQSAFKERTRHGTSVVQGHSHRLGIGWDTQEKNRFWMECGHLTDPANLGYTDYGMANWQQGFGVLYQRDSQLFPTVHAIHEGSSAFG